MPSKYLIRDFQRGGIYHIFNQGVDKRKIFLDDEDYHLFLYYLYIYLTPLEKVLRRYHNLPIRLFNKNLAKKVELLAFVIMPDHYHLLLTQTDEEGISQLMKQLANAYTQYFNQKYQRRGSLFEGAFKSTSLGNNDILAQMSRFIHLHPVMENLSEEPEYTWSSYNDYAELTTHRLCNTKRILSLFPSVYAYKKFVHDKKDYKKKVREIEKVIIEQTF
jgi:putative transposase